MDWRRVDRWGRGIGDHGIEDIDVPLDTSDSGVLSSQGSADANTAIVLVPAVAPYIRLLIVLQSDDTYRVPATKSIQSSLSYVLMY
jgi:hypothetical protein